jgi:hypothetical protein
MKAEIELLKLSRWFMVLVLLLSIASLAKPVHALTISIEALDWTTTTSPMGVVVVNHIRVTTDGAAQVTLSFYGSGYGYASSHGYFSPNPLVFAAAGSLDSTLTIPLPGPDDYCPGVSTSGPVLVQFTVQGRDPTVGAIGGPTLTINLLPIVSGLSVHVEASKPSYMKGETVTIKMDSNIPGAVYYLKISKPDGSQWATANGYVPATFTKQAADPLGTYTVVLTAYFCGTAQDVATFAITPDTYDVTVSLAGLPTDAATALLVDGNKASDMKGGDVRVLSYPIGSSHTFQVDQYVNGAAGYRYYCASNSWTAAAAGSSVFNYATQVYLDVSTDPTAVTDVTASGWYAKDASASIASVPTEVEGTKGTKYVLTTWTVDGTPRGDNGFIVIMDAPHKVVAKYETMFLLTIVSDYGNPRGMGYYKSGETAVFGVDSPVGMGIQHVFVQWSGDYTGNDPQGSITMDGPKTVTAVWTTSYFQLYLIIGTIVAIAVVAGLLVWMRRRGRPSAMKPLPPPPPPATEVHEKPAEPSSPTLETGTTSKPAVSIALRCTNCGHVLKEGQIYCPECGQKQID